MLPTSLSDLDRLFSTKFVMRSKAFCISECISQYTECRCWHLLSCPSLAVPLQPNNKNTYLLRFVLAFFVLKKAWRIIYKAFCSFLERCLSTYSNLIPSTVVNIHIYLNRIDEAESLGLIERKSTFCSTPCFIFILS